MNDALLAQLAERLSSQRVSDLHPLVGGASSLTFAGRRHGRRVVVKVAPPGVPPTAHRDVLRQSRMIKTLSPTEVPVPQVLFEDTGDPPLFVMSFLDGISCEPLFDDADAGSEDVVAERFRNAAATLARLHGLEPGDHDLAGEPVVGPLEEVERWCRTLETVDPTLAPGWSDVADALRDKAPPSLRPAIVHGDFRLGNLLADSDRITAVIDWEIWSVGDPRVDAGWFLINCDPQTYRRPTRYGAAVPPLEELVTIYRDAMKMEVPELDWFCALACFKSTATWSLIVKHNRRREVPDAGLEEMAPVVPRLLARAGDLLD
ncbi:phosphotransferase family protein [Candidatus Mycobacterium wuenschmannii]|uniref:Phosphotransferase family protein n=1 Tax=Candidatus Mycobacterium wuenschmannii TaxID=3027808 RepID=A0ABY8W7I2_9MYCO|nr:phosphotransferase family protein [Candidatus Mycobacterium wuenschmannii]WIM90398.1 phosphotransferase family protein [Candidatus Mycobacterium wuenschmannii]